MARNIPAYLLTKKNIFLLLIFIMFFSLIFINIYRPFNSTSWIENGANRTYYFLQSGILVICGIFVLSISRILMFLLKNKIQLTYLTYFTWIFAEILIMSLIYSLVSKYYFLDSRFLFVILPKVALYITLTLFLPYSVSWLYMALQEKNKAIAKIVETNKHIKDDDFSTLPQDKYNLIHFQDDNGVLRLSIKFENLFYIESADNYINIYYENKGKVVRFLCRKSLKSIEDGYKEYPLIRSHRSYIVNMEKIKVLKKGKDGFFLDFENDELPDIPVSKTYSESVLEMFNK